MTDRPASTAEALQLIAGMQADLRALADWLTAHPPAVSCPVCQRFPACGELHAVRIPDGRGALACFHADGTLLAALPPTEPRTR